MMKIKPAKLYFLIFVALVITLISVYVALTVFPITLDSILGPRSPDRQYLYDDFENVTYKLELGHVSADNKWASIYTGFGTMGVAKDLENNGNHFFEEPQPPKFSNMTHSSLAITTKKYQDFDLTLDMMTVKQLRKEKPNPWETAWIVWHFTDNYHWYAFQLKTNGIQLEKKDNDVKDDAAEIFLQTKNSSAFKLGAWNKIRILHENSYTNTPHIQIWVDKEKVFDYIDNKIPNSAKIDFGAIGLYSEDASVRFDNVYIKPL